MTKLPNGTEVSIYCPDCQTPRKLVVRTNRMNDTQFLGCPNWPVCRHTKPIPEDFIMQALGATSLPGFSREDIL